MTPKHVYVTINENRNGFRALLLNTWEITPQSSAASVNDTIETLDNTMQSEGYLMKGVTVIVSSTDYLKIKPEEKLYAGRSYWKFRKGWTDLLAEKLWKQCKLDCVVSFKNNTISPSENAQYFAKVEGSCTECKAKVIGIVQCQPARKEDVIFNIVIENNMARLHTGQKERQLRGERRDKVAQHLIETRKAASTYRRQEAAKLKKFGDMDPSVLPSNQVLRKAKEEALLKKYGLQYGNYALNLLHHAKHGKHIGTIRKISLEKFSCISCMCKCIGHENNNKCIRHGARVIVKQFS